MQVRKQQVEKGKWEEKGSCVLTEISSVQENPQRQWLNS